MSFNLEKEVEKAKFVVSKRGVSPNLRASVVMDLDVSGSARPLFNSGAMQEAFQRILPIGITFDDNKEIDVFTFANGKEYTTHIEPNATDNNYTNYIQENILNNSKVPKWGATDYEPVLRENLISLGFITKGLFSGSKLQKKAKSGTPAVIYFFTDGANDRSDRKPTRQLLKDCQDTGTEVYFMFVGIGPSSSFSFIEELGEEFDNVGFLSVSDLSSLSQDDSYEKLLPEELTVWLKDYM